MSPDHPYHLPVKLSILIVDDHPLIRQGIRSLMQTAVKELEFLEAATGAEARQQLQCHSPDLLIVDMALPDIHGLDLIQELKKDNLLPTPILALSMYGEAAYAERALRAGASGYVMKEEVGGVLLKAVERVLEGDVHLSPHVARQIAARLSGLDQHEGSVADLLTDREFEIWRRLGSGLSTRKIASLLDVSPKTVETHCYNIRQKTGISDMTELVHAATRWVHGGPPSAEDRRSPKPAELP